MRTRLSGLFLVTLVGCAAPQDDAPPPVVEAPPVEIAPSTTFVDTQGKRWSLGEGTFKAELIEFWSTTCGPCLEAMPSLHRLDRDLEPKGLLMLSINTDSEESRARAFLRRRPFPNPVVLDDGTAWREWKVERLPTLFLVRQGRILRRWEGALDVREVRSALQEVMAEDAAKRTGPSSRRPTTP